MSAPAWLAGSFAVLMIMIAVCCATRLAIPRLRGRNTERDADALHVLMGMAMAGMLQPRLTPVPVTAWRAVFAAAAAWFAWQAIRPARCAGGHPAARAVECAAMVYMLLPVDSWPSSHGPAMAMPGGELGKASEEDACVSHAVYTPCEPLDRGARGCVARRAADRAAVAAGMAGWLR